ncbi:MAG TPA: amidohydrolase family protein [Bacteroidota bacterium]|nr:amidohydrolase family protein [Bacteroidota bacterium]
MQESVKLIENAFVFTCDENQRSGVLSILIRGDKIVEIGKRADAMSAQYSQLERINAEGKILLPGFIDAHHRAESVVLRFLDPLFVPQQNRSLNLVRKASEYLTTKATEDELKTLYRLAFFSALRAGVTTLSEYGMDYLDKSFRAAIEALQQTQQRAYIGLHNGDQYEAALLYKSKNIHYAAVLPTDRNLTLYNLQNTLRIAQQRQLPIIINDCADIHAFESFKKKFGKGIIQLGNEHHIFDSPVFLVNVRGFDKADAELIVKRKFPVIVTPTNFSNANDNSSTVEDLINRVTIALGSGWGNANPFEEMRQLISLYLSKSVAIASPFEILAAHTIGGAQALSLSNEAGSIKEGKKADIVFLNASGIFHQPCLVSEDAELVLQHCISEMTAHDVADVMIGGEFYVREGHLLTCSEDELAREASSLMKQIYSVLGEENVHQEAGLVVPFSSKKEVIDGISSDEGFRIIRDHEKINTDTNTNLETPAQPQSIKKNLHKVFGEDDIE